MMANTRQAQLDKVFAQVRTCFECPLSRSRRIAVPGEGPLDAELLWLGEAPGGQEDAVGRPFVGPSGKLLRRELQALGMDPESMFITNAVKCRPPGNRAPRADELAICTSLYLARQVELVRPRAIVALGATAAGAVLAGGVRITQEHGSWRRDYELTDQPCVVFVTYHPSAALRSERWRAEFRADLERLRAALSKGAGRLA